MLKKLPIILLFTAAVTGCASPVQHQTASGKPEATMNAAPDKVKPLLMRDMANRGWRLTKDTQYDMTFEKPLEGASSFLLASRYDSTPVGRLSFSIFPQGSGTRVVADFSGVTNPNSPYEHRLDLNNGQESPKVQEILDIIAGEIARSPKT